MGWKEFLRAEKARKRAFVDQLLSSTAIPASARPLWRQLIEEQQQHIREIDQILDGGKAA